MDTPQKFPGAQFYNPFAHAGTLITGVRMSLSALLATGLMLSCAAFGEEPNAPAAAKTDTAHPAGFIVTPGTKIPLSLLNSVSTKHSAEGDRIYLETVFPILVNGRIVIPPGSYVAGTVTQVKRPGRLKGRGEIYVRFDSLTLPNGVTRDFRARMSAMDGRATEEFDKTEG